MAMNDVELGRLRDEIGTAVPPSTQSLQKDHAELGSWIAVALRTLRRRRAAAAAGGTPSSVALSGVVSVSMGKVDIAALDRQIERLEGELAIEQGSTGVPGARIGRIVRHTARG